MTPKEALELLENRVSTLAINHKIGSRYIANLEIKDIVTCIETHVIPTFEKTINEHEALKRDIKRFMELITEVKFRPLQDEVYLLQQKLSKVGKEE